MAASSEESFKVCGLCSQLVDESVEVTAAMRAFLCSFLCIKEAKLPAKICIECYQRATECRGFKERCDKAILKLNKSAVYSSMILGGTAGEINAASHRSPKEEQKLLAAERKTQILLDGAQIVRDSSPPAAAKPAPANETPAAATSTPAPKGGRGRPGRKSAIVPRALSPEVEVEPLGPRTTRGGASKEPPPERTPAGRRTSQPPPPPPKAALSSSPPPRGRAAAASAAAKKKPKIDRQKKPENAKVAIKFSEREAAEKAAKGSHVGNGQAAAATAVEAEPVPGPSGLQGRQAAKRKAVASPSPTRASRGGTVREPEPEVVPESAGTGSSGDAFDQIAPANKTRRTGSGRAVKETKKAGFVSFDSFAEVTIGDSEESDQMPLSKKATPKPRPAKAAAPKATPKAKPAPAPKPKPTPPPPPPAAPSPAKKAGPASAKKKAAAAPAARAPEPDITNVTLSDDDEDEDMEEIFPAVGPYQCEICQKITDTKQEFVDHIKNYHIHVVDEEVLRSLESDLRKNKKKAARAAAAKAGGGAVNGIGSAKKMTPSSPMKKAPEDLSPA